MVTKKLHITKETRALIESVIKDSPKYQGNEELIDLFCEAIYKKSYLLIEAIKDKARLRRHLVVICESAMNQIIKEKQRFDETKLLNQIQKKNSVEPDIVSLKKAPFAENEVLKEELERQRLQGIVNLKEEIQRSEKYDAVDVLIDPLEFCPQKRVSEATLTKLNQVIKQVDAKFPAKHYYDIFSFRYAKKMNQMEIARILKISQVELSKRFVEMIRLAREEV